MKIDRKTKGKIGEAIAIRYLTENGIEILEKNYRYKRGEIDIIGLLGNRLLVFYEVKFRKNNQFGEPESFISERQKELILEVADRYIHDINWIGDIRFDVIALSDRNNTLDHIEDAFYG